MSTINWSNLQQVIDYCRRLGAGNIVVKHPDRSSYNITHASRTDLYKADWVVFTA